MEEKKKRWRPSLTAYRKLEKEVSELKNENASLERSNQLMEEEMERLRGALDEAGDTIQAMDKEIYALCHRNLWQRILNK